MRPELLTFPKIILAASLLIGQIRMLPAVIVSCKQDLEREDDDLESRVEAIEVGEIWEEEGSLRDEGWKGTAEGLK